MRSLYFRQIPVQIQQMHCIALLYEKTLKRLNWTHLKIIENYKTFQVALLGACIAEVPALLDIRSTRAAFAKRHWTNLGYAQLGRCANHVIAFPNRSIVGMSRKFTSFIVWIFSVSWWLKGVLTRSLGVQMRQLEILQRALDAVGRPNIFWALRALLPVSAFRCSFFGEEMIKQLDRCNWGTGHFTCHWVTSVEKNIARDGNGVDKLEFCIGILIERLGRNEYFRSIGLHLEAFKLTLTGDSSKRRHARARVIHDMILLTIIRSHSQ